MTTKNHEEGEKIILELAKKGMMHEKIGLVLKKEHKITKKHLGKRISKVLKENNLYIDSDIKNLRKSIEKLKEHLKKNKADKSCKRSLMIKDAKLRKLEKI